MQLVPQISTALWTALGDGAQRLNVLVELYDQDAFPTIDGFDPADALLLVANKTLTFLGNDYLRRVESVGKVNRTITEKFNTVSVTLNSDESNARDMAAFALSNDLEGMFMVVRLVSRAVTATTLADSFVVFTGKCEKVYDASDNAITISAKQYLGSVDDELPPRVFSPEDEEGRTPDNPLYEGFNVGTINVTQQFTERVPRGGILGLFGAKKTVHRTTQYTSHRGADSEQVVPIVLGRAHIVLILLSSIDVGSSVYAIFAGAEGPIQFWHDAVLATPNLTPIPASVYLRNGEAGGTGDQVPIPSPDGDTYAGNNYYSHTAWIAFASVGSEVSEDDPAPDGTAILLGLVMPVPDSSGTFTLSDFTDNPAFHARWLLTDTKGYNLDPLFINDPQCVKTACYCDDPVIDETDGERVVLPASLESVYNTWWRRYNSTGLLTPCYFRHYYLDDPQSPQPEVRTATPTYYDPIGTPPVYTPDTLIRRRFTSNIYLKERMKKADFLFKVLLPTFGGYITQNAKGQLDIKCKRPGDNTIIRSDVTAGDDEVAVNSILAWLSDKSGEVIVGVDLLTSEVRSVVGTRYSAVANDITLTVTGNLTASGATLTGGDDDNPAIGLVTVTGLGTFTVTIDGRDVVYETETASALTNGAVGDTIESATAMLAHHLKADPTFKTYLKFTWDKTDPTVISIQSKLGFLELDSPLEEAHSIAEQVLRIQMSFSDGLSTPADTPASNILRGSMKWPVGGRQSSVNRIDGTFTDSPNDFQSQELRTRDAAHVARTRKTLPEKVNLTGVDSYSQAKRRENTMLAELRDLDFFMQHSSDRRAMLLEEGDLICNTHASGGFRNVPLRIEEVSLDLQHMTVSIIARRYATSAYSDDAVARTIPLPSGITPASVGPPDIAFNTADYLPNGLIQTTASEGITSVRGGAIFGASIYGQNARVRLKRPGESAFTQIAVITPDSDFKAVFEFIASDEGTYTVQLEVCNLSGICNTTKPTASIIVAYGSLWGIMTEGGTLVASEGGTVIEQEH